MADNLTPEQRSKTMSRIRSKNTRIEMRVRQELHRRGYRYRVHPKHLPGKPDVVFGRYKVAVFIDGDFWHGWNFSEWSSKLAPYWRDKIERNQRRDRDAAAELVQAGWTVVRVWEHEVKKDFEMCIQRIEDALEERRSNVRK